LAGERAKRVPEPKAEDEARAAANAELRDRLAQRFAEVKPSDLAAMKLLTLAALFRTDPMNIESAIALGWIEEPEATEDFNERHERIGRAGDQAREVLLLQTKVPRLLGKALQAILYASLQIQPNGQLAHSSSWARLIRAHSIDTSHEIERLIEGIARDAGALPQRQIELIEARDQERAAELAKAEAAAKESEAGDEEA
jgi:hypothetical protein